MKISLNLDLFLNLNSLVIGPYREYLYYVFNVASAVLLQNIICITFKLKVL